MQNKNVSKSSGIKVGQWRTAHNGEWSV